MILCFRCASLTFDAMTIKPSVRFSYPADKAVGFEDLPFHKTSEDVANLLVVFMLRGNYRPWKQPIGYFLVSHSISPEYLHQVILRFLCDLQDTGIEVSGIS